MPITITIPASAYGSGGPLEEFVTRANPPHGNPRQTPSFSNPPGSTNAPGPGYIASAHRTVRTSHINPDGSTPSEPFTGAWDAAIDQLNDIFVHVSPTSGSSVIRGASNFDPNQAEFDPTYGLNVPVAGIQLQEDVFETAINEPVGAQFKANLQDLVSRGILLIHDHNGATMDPGEIADYSAP